MDTRVRVRVRTCPWCDHQFTCSSGKQRTCSPSCGQALRLYTERGPLTSPLVLRACRVCDAAYTKRRTCGCDLGSHRVRSPHAANYRRRTEHYGGLYEDIDRLTVFERDQWRCGICHKAVDRSASWPNHRAVSLDHIVPLSSGGDHTYANVQCAHLGCNWAKNGRAANDQLRLIG